ncbi:MAG: WD40 repeat domain-containing protein [Chloroflexota bacterium]
MSQTGFLQVWSWDDRSLRDSTDRFGTNPYTEFVFSPDDNYFVNYSSIYGDGLTYLWQFDGNMIEQERFARPEEITLAMDVDAVAISDDGRFIAYAQYSELYVYDRELDTHTRVASASFLVDMTFTSDGTLMVVDTSRGQATIHTVPREDLLSGEIVYHTQEGVSVSILRNLSPTIWNIGFSTDRAMEFSHEGNYLIAYQCESRNALLQASPFLQEDTCDDPRLIVVDTATGELVGQLGNVPSDHNVQSVSVSQDGRYVSVIHCEATEQEYGGALCQDMLQQVEGYEADGYQVDVWRIEDFVSLMPDSPLMPIAQFTELPNVEFATLVPTDDTDDLLLVTSGWQSVASAQAQHTTQFWVLNEVGESESVYELEVRNPAFSSDGSLMIGMADNQVQVWQIPIEALLRADS